MIQLTRRQAREIALAAQGLSATPDRPATKAAILEMVRRLGCVQLDTIAVVARSQYLVLWSRLGAYDPSLLDELLHPDRLVFEYWAHAASIIPIELYPAFRRRMLTYKQRNGREHQEWMTQNAHVLDHVREAVRARGPLGAIDFATPERDDPVPPWSWWGGKPTNRALDVLWSTGELMVERRVGFQRRYDLRERLLPGWHDDDLPSPDEERRTLALAAARAMGVVIPAWLNDYFRTRWGIRGEPGPGPDALLADLARDDLLISVEIEHLGHGYVHHDYQSTLEDVRRGARSDRVTLLSPFDNLIWDRRRARDLFNFDYRIECYTPAPKRRYGYYTMPILADGALVGRLDPKVDRREQTLVVKSLHWERGVTVDDTLGERLSRVLEDFARFNGARAVVVDDPTGAVGSDRAFSVETPER